LCILPDRRYWLQSDCTGTTGRYPADQRHGGPLVDEAVARKLAREVPGAFVIVLSAPCMSQELSESESRGCLSKDEVDGLVFVAMEFRDGTYNRFAHNLRTSRTAQ
jgi:hypothetical protein